MLMFWTIRQYSTTSQNSFAVRRILLEQREKYFPLATHQVILEMLKHQLICYIYPKKKFNIVSIFSLNLKILET